MRNKILAIAISVFTVPSLFVLYWVVEKFLLVRVILVIAMIVCMFILIYKLSKLILDDYYKGRKKGDEN